MRPKRDEDEDEDEDQSHGEEPHQDQDGISLVMFAGETMEQVRWLSKRLGCTAQDVVAEALRSMYEREHGEDQSRHEGGIDGGGAEGDSGEGCGDGLGDADGGSGSEDPFRSW